MLPGYGVLNFNEVPQTSSSEMPTLSTEENNERISETMVVPKRMPQQYTPKYVNTPIPSKGKLCRTFDFDLSTLPNDVVSPDISPVQDSLPYLESSLSKGAPLSLKPTNDDGFRKGSVSNQKTSPKQTDLRIHIADQPTLVVQSPKTPTLSRKLKAQSLDSDSSTSNVPADCLEVPRDVFSMPNTPKRQIPKSQVHKFGVRSHSGTNLGIDTVSTSGSNLSSFGSNQSISGSQTLKTLPEIMTLSDFSQGKSEPVRIRAKGLLERRGSNVSLTIDLGAAEAKNTNHNRLNTARSVSNLNLTNIGSDNALMKCKCRTDFKCECPIKKIDCKKCNSNLKKFQKLSTESCLCDETTTSSSCQGYKLCQYSRLGCLNYLSYMRRKSLSNENLYIGPSYDYKKYHKKSEYPKNMLSQFKNQVLSEDFQLHLQNIQYLQTAGNVLSKKQLKECCKAENLKDLHKEFWELPQNFQEKSFVSGSQSKNRYKTILPNEHSRVVLELGQGQDCSGVEGYINANYIKGHDYTETAYIATQGPLSHTTSDLWQMVMQSNARKLVMLTPINEKGRVKCEIYFPVLCNETITCGKFEIKCLNVHDEKSYAVRTFRLRDLTAVRRKIKLTKKQDRSVDVSSAVDSVSFCESVNNCGFECKKCKHSSTQATTRCNIDRDANRPIGNLKNSTISNVLYKDDRNEIVDKIDCLHLSNEPLSSCNLNDRTVEVEQERFNNNSRMEVNKSLFMNDSYVSVDTLVIDDDDDDIFMPMDPNTRTFKPRALLRSRDMKFSDDFTDFVCSDSAEKGPYVSMNDGSSKKAETLDQSETDCVLEGDRIIKHYWYQTWPDHNLANTEEILALALDVLDLKEEAPSLYVGVDTNLDIDNDYEINLNDRCKSDCDKVDDADDGIGKKDRTDGSESESGGLVCSQRSNLASNLNFPIASSPDMKFIKTVESLIDPSDRNPMNFSRNQNVDSVDTAVPIIVHCSAGIGRTGCFLAILNGIQQLKYNLNVDILAIVCALRLNRGGMVQTAEQYELIHKVLMLYGEFVDK